MAVIPSRDVGELLQHAGPGYFNATAGGTGDATEVDGATVNRMTYGMPESAVLAIQYITSLTADKTLAFTITLQDSADGSSWTDVTVSDFASAITVKTGALTDSEDFHVSHLNLKGLRQYVRAQVKPDLSHTSTDTAVGNFCFVLGGTQDSAKFDAADASN